MSPERIRRAAEILREEAAGLQQSHTIDAAWSDDPLDAAVKVACDEMVALAEELEAATVVDWISVSERLPDSDETVLVCTSGDSEPVWLGYHGDPFELGEPRWYSVTNDELTVTDWAPVPTGPAHAEGNRG